MDRLYLDDLTVGQLFVSATHTLHEADIIAFATQFDPQPFHLDDAAARNTLFGGLAASGWHTAAIAMKLLVDSLPLAGGIIGSGVELAWPRATRPGDMLHLETEIVSITSSRTKPDRGVVVARTRTLTQTGDVVQVTTAKILATRRPHP